jgi:hypothetical protein
MKKILALAVAVVALSACTDAERASFGALGDEAKIVCYSGAQVVFDDVSTGKVQQLDGDGITFKSKTSGRYVRAFADCIVTN